MDSIELRSLPSVGINELCNLPDTVGVYFVVASGSIVYIGKTEVGFSSRWKNHHQMGKLLRDYPDARIHCFEMNEEDDILGFERDAIAFYKPLMNGIVEYPVNGIGGRVITKTKVTTSIPGRLAERIKLRAKQEDRDVSSLVAYLLERAMEGWRPAAELKAERTYKKLKELIEQSFTA